MRRRIAVTAVLLVVVALVVGGLLWWRGQPATDFERAMSFAPNDAERVTWTDWSAVRAELGADLNPDSSPDRVLDFLDEGYDADLTSTSALVQSAPVLQESYGFSPASLDWELFSQSTQGAVVVMALPESTDLEALADGFEDLGYERPDEDAGVWVGGGSLLARIGRDLTPELQHLAIDTDERLVIASDTEGYLAQVLDGLGEGELPTDLADTVEPSGDPLSAVAYDSDYVCTQLAMSQADEADQAQAQSLVEGAGEVNPITGFAMSAQPGGGIRVVMAFESEEQAKTNADSRAVLARGPAPGQGGDFADRFSVSQVTAEGNVVTMALDPVDGQYVLSDLSAGPVLFATC